MAPGEQTADPCRQGENADYPLRRLPSPSQFFT
jgi:hypothetical protein